MVERGLTLTYLLSSEPDDFYVRKVFWVYVCRFFCGGLLRPIDLEVVFNCFWLWLLSLLPFWLLLVNKLDYTLLFRLEDALTLVTSESLTRNGFF